MSRYSLSLPTDLKRQAERWAAEQGVSLNQFILWALAEKVGDLEQRLDDPRFPRVAYRRGGAGAPEPVLRGTSIRLRTLAVAAETWGWDAERIAEEHDLPIESVREALEFVATHRAEIDAAIRTEAEAATSRVA